ncbi:uncharacterized protein LOC106156274 isoform X1 [Lingula anatina]|uniref:Uncharacterized protein LOC106156274 isoform X1 n=1 Tax=Lingula anatina TaxID=7574 RepID=A0A1S3HPG1_LINAN|nr:uncharacterized protein LOC106156274 isoform X1 [Lingula anatina]|eukprot:XP_013386924.1 uncharacterized protein LOC106156274 isoform X1 [Lingula anatina]
MESSGTINLGKYARLCFLVIELGTEAMRQYFKKILLPSGTSLQQFLSSNRVILEGMLSKRKLNKTQFDLLFPPGGTMPATCLNNFDITLLFSLIRDLHPKTSDVPEPKSDVWNNLQAARSSPDLPRQILDLIEIKFYRNSLAHSKSVNITDSDYELMWQSITISVLNLGVTTEQLDSVKNITIDPEKEQEYITRLKNQEQEEQNLKEGLHTRIRRVEHAVTVIVVLVVAASMGMVLRDKLPKSILGLIDMLQFGMANLGSFSLLLLTFMITVVGVTLVKEMLQHQASRLHETIKCGFSDPSTVQIVSRREWGAREASGPMSPLLIPVKYVIIAHTVSGLCESVEACSGILRGIQQRHMADRGWSDIAYNYHIADDGRVYEGRGPSIAGSHTKGWNLNSWGIAFMGDFSYRLPSPRALWALKAFLKNSVENGFLEENYVLLGHCQVAPFASPGDTLYRELKTWDHWQDIHA